MQKAKRRQKYCLTLLEISIALFLTGILLSTLWGLYHHWLVAHQEVQKKQIQTHKILFLKQKLDKLSDLIAAPCPKGADNHFLFTPKNKIEGFPTVCFSYSNEPDPELSFNGLVRSLLYINNEKKICLTTWSSEKTTRTEILLDQVSSFSLSYFDTQTNFWRDEWPEELNYTPLWIRLTVEASEKTVLLFRIGSPSEPILYLEQGDPT